MNPLVGLAISLVPELLKLIKSQKNDAKLTDKVVKTVETATAESSPENASKKIFEDPKIKADLELRLAEIAREAQQAAFEDADKQRESALKQAELANQSTSGARENLRDLVRNSPLLAWTPSILSYIVVVGFLITLALLGLGIVTFEKKDHDETVLQIFNVLVGALAAAFATVMNFWLGSSVSSRSKDTSLEIRSSENQIRADEAVARSGGGPPPPPTSPPA